MSEKCVQCLREIGSTDCQQGQKIDDTWYPIHIGCADLWANEDWESDQGHTEANLETVQAYVAELEPGDSVTIERREMKRIEFLRLPEL